MDNQHRYNSLDRIVTVAVLALAAGVSLFALRNNDIWWLMAVGRHIVETTSFIHEDPFSFAMTGQAWSPQAWLSGIVFYCFYKLGGVVALVLLRVALVTATVAALIAAVRRVGVSALAVAPLVIIALLVSQTRFIVRGHLFEYLAIVLLVGFLLTSHRRRGRSFFVIPVLVQVIWTNMHPSFLLGPLLAILFFGGEYLSSRLGATATGPGAMFKHDYRRAAFLVGAMLIACLINPAPVAFLTQPFAGETRELLQRFTWEWKSPFDPVMADAPFHPWYEIMLGLSALAVALSLPRIALAPVLMLGVLVVASLQSHRFRVEFALMAVAMIPVLLQRAPALGALRDRLSHVPFGGWRAVALVATAVLGVAGARQVEVSLTRLDRYPDTAFQFIVDNNIAHRPYHPIGFGSYMVWDLYGKRQTFIDGRIVSARVYRDFLAAQASAGGVAEVARRYELDAFILPSPEASDAGMTTMHRALASDSAWAFVHMDEQALVYVRRDAVEGPWLASHEFVEYHPLTIANRRLTESSLDIMIAELEHATEIVAGVAALWRDLGLARQARGDVAGAVVAYERAAQITPDDPIVWTQMAGAAQAAQDADAAVRATSELTRLTPGEPSAWYQHAMALQAHGRNADAVEAFDNAIERDPEFMRAWEDAFRMHLETRAWDAAIPLVQRLKTGQPDNYLGFYLDAELQVRMDRPDHAVTMAQEALRRNPRLPGAWMLIATVSSQNRQYPRALEALDQVLLLVPDDARARSMRAELVEYLNQ